VFGNLKAAMCARLGKDDQRGGEKGHGRETKRLGNFNSAPTTYGDPRGQIMTSDRTSSRKRHPRRGGHSCRAG